MDTNSPVHQMRTWPLTTLPDLEVPSLFGQLRGQFTVQRELGRGGMGIVYLARDEKLERPAAIKVLPSELAGSAGCAKSHGQSPTRTRAA